MELLAGVLRISNCGELIQWLSTFYIILDSLKYPYQVGGNLPGGGGKIFTERDERDKQSTWDGYRTVPYLPTWYLDA